MKHFLILPVIIFSLLLFPVPAFATNLPTEIEITEVLTQQAEQESEQETDETVITESGDSIVEQLSAIYVQLVVTDVLIAALFVYLFLHFSIKKGW